MTVYKWRYEQDLKTPLQLDDDDQGTIAPRQADFATLRRYIQRTDHLVTT
jgi:hypothetical protein